MTATLVEPALDYLARGWSVIPMRTRDKRPLIRWQIYQRQRADADEVRDWFRRWPDANVGIVTGAVSGMVVLDIDPKHSGDRSLGELERAHRPLPPTLEAVTGGGGRHLYFAHPGGIVHNKVGLAPGIDLRGDGGCVVAPPSVHASGRRYAWVAAPGQRSLAALPAWLLHDAGLDRGHSGHPLAHWRRMISTGVGEGERNNAIASIAGHLLWHGVDADVTVELLLCWNSARCRPPLAAEEVVRTVESITHLHLHRQRAGDTSGGEGPPASGTDD